MLALLNKKFVNFFLSGKGNVRDTILVKASKMNRNGNSKHFCVSLLTATDRLGICRKRKNQIVLDIKDCFYRQN